MEGGISMPVIGTNCVFINKKCSQAARYCRTQQMLTTEHPSSVDLGAGDNYSGLPVTWSCALELHQECIFQFYLICRESPAVWAPCSLIKGERVKFPSGELKGRWWRRGTFFLTLTLIPFPTVTPLLSWDLSFTFPARWDLEHFTHLPHGRCLMRSQDSCLN